MKAAVGDRLVIKEHHVGDAERDAEMSRGTWSQGRSL